MILIWKSINESSTNTNHIGRISVELETYRISSKMREVVVRGFQELSQKLTEYDPEIDKKIEQIRNDINLRMDQKKNIINWQLAQEILAPIFKSSKDYILQYNQELKESQPSLWGKIAKGLGIAVIGAAATYIAPVLIPADIIAGSGFLATAVTQTRLGIAVTGAITSLFLSIN